MSINIADFCKPGDERALLSYTFKNIDYFYDLCSKINDHDFLDSEHRIIFNIMKSLLDRGVNQFDIPMIVNEAQDQGVFGLLPNGYDYIRAIHDMDVDYSNFNIYLKNVMEASIKYKLLMVLNKGIETLSSNSKTGLDSETLIGTVEASIMDLSTESKSIKEPINLYEGLQEYIEERRNSPVIMSGISTGYPILDKQIDGLVPSTFTIIAARKKMGKSTLLTNISAHIAYIQRIPVLYVDTEMSFMEWRPRVIAMLSKIPERIIKHGGYTPEQYKTICDCIKIIEKGKLFHAYMPNYNVEKLLALYKKYKMKENIGLMVFDYLKEPSSGLKTDDRKEYQILGDVTSALKDLAGELNIPALGAVQLNRDHDVADSDRIARYGDVIAYWATKKQDELEAGGRDGGSHKLVIRDTRRGGMTPEEGIGYKFIKRCLRITEVLPPFQLIPYGDEVVNHESSDDD